MKKRSEQIPTDSYFYLEIQLSKCITRFNIRVGPVRTQTTNMQKMINSEMNKQNIPNLYICSLDKSESKRINTEERESHVCSTDGGKLKRIIINACYLDERESKSVHIGVNTSEIKDANN